LFASAKERTSSNFSFVMFVLFVNGVMNLLWVVFITFAILSEKVLPFGHITSRFFGLVLVGWGTYLIIL